MNNKLLAVAAIASGFMLAPQMADAGDKKFYVGVGGGYSAFTNENPDLSQLNGTGTVNDGTDTLTLTGTTSIDDGAGAYKIFAGYNINKMFAVEAAYVDLGEYEANTAGTVTSTGGAGGTFTGNLNWGIDTTGFALTGLAKHQFMDDLTAFVKVGGFFWDTDLEIQASGTVTTNTIRIGGTTYAVGAGSGTYTASESGVSFVAGLGGEYDITDNIAARAEWEYYDSVGDSSKTGESDVHMS
jgi:opacity protein-like surface antigen